MFRRPVWLVALAAAALLTACSGGDVAPTKERLLAKADLPQGVQLTYPDLAEYQRRNADRLGTVTTEPAQCRDLIKSVFAGGKGVLLGAIKDEQQIVEILTQPVSDRVATLKKLTEQCSSVTTRAQGQSATSTYAEFDTSGVSDADDVYGIKVTTVANSGTPSVAVLISAERNGVAMTLNVSSTDEREPDRIALANKALSKLDS